MSKSEGIYLSADYRVTDARTRKLVDDASIKLLTVHYPPDEGGPKALIGYSGLAILPTDGTPIGTWIRETLRGETEDFNTSMAHLRERLDRDVAPLHVPLRITVLALQGDGKQRFVGGFSNARDPRSGFAYEIREENRSFAIADGSGRHPLAASEDVALLESQLHVRPRRTPFEHMRLLAAVNRRVAQREKTVSPFCHVAFVNADESTSPASRTYTEPGETAPFDMSVLLFGIDMTELTKDFVDEFKTWRAGGDPIGPLDAETADKSVKRRP